MDMNMSTISKRFYQDQYEYPHIVHYMPVSVKNNILLNNISNSLRQIFSHHVNILQLLMNECLGLNYVIIVFRQRFHFMTIISIITIGISYQSGMLFGNVYQIFLLLVNPIDQKVFELELFYLLP